MGIIETLYGTVDEPMDRFRSLVCSLPLDIRYPIFAYAINNTMTTYYEYLYFKDLLHVIPFYSLRITILGPEETFVKLIYDNCCVMKLKSRDVNWQGFMNSYSDLFKHVKIDYFCIEYPFVGHDFSPFGKHSFLLRKADRVTICDPSVPDVSLYSQMSLVTCFEISDEALLNTISRLTLKSCKYLDKVIIRKRFGGQIIKAGKKYLHVIQSLCSLLRVVEMKIDIIDPQNDEMETLLVDTFMKLATIPNLVMTVDNAFFSVWPPLAPKINNERISIEVLKRHKILSVYTSGEYNPSITDDLSIVQSLNIHSNSTYGYRHLSPLFLIKFPALPILELVLTAGNITACDFHLLTTLRCLRITESCLDVDTFATLSSTIRYLELGGVPNRALFYRDILIKLPNLLFRLKLFSWNWLYVLDFESAGCLFKVDLIVTSNFWRYHDLEFPVPNVPRFNINVEINDMPETALSMQHLFFVSIDEKACPAVNTRINSDLSLLICVNCDIEPNMNLPETVALLPYCHVDVTNTLNPADLLSKFSHGGSVATNTAHYILCDTNTVEHFWENGQTSSSKFEKLADVGGHYVLLVKRRYTFNDSA
ncbi:unnamed protein product [Ambrosiozyma monospora]|uniref:Unnamed protein product n=1 Tax=Ambrosiozyma monospora TaxID=43982 RepID=A0A9W6YV41_AMBMO|nr:unnamed protein product [Ambrosiozyma monospora]